MATKYILDPSGDIIKVENGKTSLPFPPENISFKEEGDERNIPSEYKYYHIANEGQNVNVNTNTIQTVGVGFGSFDENSTEESSYILGTSNNDPSFNFERSNDSVNLQNSYKPFNSFTDKPEDFNKPRAFADEFEILSGMRFRADELRNDGADVLGLFFTYLAESIVRILTVEAVVLANQQILSKNRNETYENYTLRLGKYDLDEYDVFTKYVYNVLNYPHDKSTVDERLAAYFLGFSAWIAPDMVIDINKLFERNSNVKNTIQYFSEKGESAPLVGGLLTGFLGRETTLILNTTLTALTESVANILNTTHINRLKMLLRKFYQEKHWDSNILYRAKNRNDVLSFFADLNYYYFRFYIERVQVGLKLLDRYHDNLTYMDPREVESPLTRVSAQKNRNKIKIKNFKDFGFFKTSVDDISSFDNKKKNYAWNYNKTDISKNGAQSTRIRALPQGLNLNHSFYRSLALNSKNRLDISPTILQNFYISDDRRLPQELVVEIENHLEAEYMPFYFHDLRTNEILSFHAFIENISDSFTPDYNASSGFGRIDDVRSYVKTTRSISLTFMLAATSETDHDLMWYQINKIVTMCYPQWSDAFSVETKDKEGNILAGKFKYPFTQVPTASPLIRLRVGDVIKSNYSRGNLSRLHGIGDREGIDKDFNIFENSVKGQQKAQSDINTNQQQTQKDIVENRDRIQAAANEAFLASRADQNVYKKEMEAIDTKIKDLEFYYHVATINEERFEELSVESLKTLASDYYESESEEDTARALKKFNDFKAHEKKILKEHRTEVKRLDELIYDQQALRSIASDKKFLAGLKEDKALRTQVNSGADAKTSITNLAKTTKNKKDQANKNFHSVYYLLPGIYKTIGSNTRAINIRQQTHIIKIGDTSSKIKGVLIKYPLSNKSEQNVLVYADASKIVNLSGLVFVDTNVNPSKTKSNADDILRPTIEKEEGITVSNNPITRAYESGMSRGLAGFITNLDVSYNESTWETTRIGSKAPIMVKLSVAFTPIHDIPPGLDHNGMMRAPVYNVGRLNNEFFGDPHDGQGTYNNEGQLNKEYYQGAGREAAMQKYNHILNASKKKLV